jgi:hypothetical protein
VRSLVCRFCSCQQPSLLANPPECIRHLGNSRTCIHSASSHIRFLPNSKITSANTSLVRRVRTCCDCAPYASIGAGVNRPTPAPVTNHSEIGYVGNCITSTNSPASSALSSAYTAALRKASNGWFLGILALLMQVRVHACTIRASSVTISQSQATKGTDVTKQRQETNPQKAKSSGSIAIGSLIVKYSRHSTQT